MELVLHLYSCLTTSTTVQRQVLWTDQLKKHTMSQCGAGGDAGGGDGESPDLPGGTQGEVLAKGCDSVEEGGDKQ